MKLYKLFLVSMLFLVSVGGVCATEKVHMTICAILIYLLAIILVIKAFLKKNKKEAYSMLLVLVTIAGTVMGTGLVIQCITRYMIYNFAFFYIAGMSLVKYKEKSALHSERISARKRFIHRLMLFFAG